MPASRLANLVVSETLREEMKCDNERSIAPPIGQMKANRRRLCRRQVIGKCVSNGVHGTRNEPMRKQPRGPFAKRLSEEQLYLGSCGVISVVWHMCFIFI